MNFDKLCTVPDCNKPRTSSKYYCKTHYFRVHNYGDINHKRVYPFKNLTGQRFDRLLVLGIHEKRSKRNDILWDCLCDCGVVKPIIGYTLTGGRTKSCGCLNKEQSRKRSTTHGQSHTKEYQKACGRKNKMKKMYGITLADYDKMLFEQNYVCAICEFSPKNNKPLYVDHDHTSGKIRQLLCQGCNTGLGCFNESQEILIKACQYLQKHS